MHTVNRQIVTHTRVTVMVAAHDRLSVPAPLNDLYVTLFHLARGEAEGGAGLGGLTRCVCVCVCMCVCVCVNVDGEGQET